MQDAALVMRLREKISSMLIRLLKTPWMKFNDDDNVLVVFSGIL